MKKILTFNNIAYEFLGSLLVAIAFNLNHRQGQDLRNYIMTIFIVSIWSWKVSSAHFNFAVTIGSIFAKTDNKEDFKSKMGDFGITALCQFSGAFLGIGISYLCSNITTNPANGARTFHPDAPVLCPVNSPAN